MVQKNRNKIYINVIATIVIILVGIVGCTKEEPILTKGGDGTGTFISFSMQLGDSKSGTRYMEFEKSLKPEENMVYEVRVVFYSALSGKVVRTVDLEAYNVNDRDNPTGLDIFRGQHVSFGNAERFTSSGIQLTEEELKVGEYHVLVIANPNDRIKNSTDMGSDITLSDLEDEVLDYNEQEMIGADGKRFMMINYMGSNYITRKFNFWGEKDEAEKNPVLIKIARQVAIVLPYLNPQYERSVNSNLPVEMNRNITGPFSDLEAHNVVWDMNVVNKKMYWMRKPTAGEYPDNEQEWYSIDPNFDKLSQANDGKLQDRLNNFVYITKEQIDNNGRELRPLDDIFEDLASADYAYVPENTMTAQEQYGDVMTSVVIGLNLVRKSGGSGGSRNAGNYEHWICFDQGQDKMLIPTTEYDPTELSDILDMYNDPTVWDPQEDKLIQIPGENLSEEELRSIEVTFRTLLNAIKYMMDNYGYDGGSQGPDWDNMDSFEVGNFSFYKEGRMYYSLPVSHLGLQTGYPGIFRRYGVVRNNAYGLRINRIVAPGRVSPEPTLVPPGDMMNIGFDGWFERPTDYNFGNPISD